MKKTVSVEDIEELTKIGKFTQAEILERKEAENKRAVNDLEKRLKNISLEELANNPNINNEEYFPYLFNFEYILNRLKEEERKDVSTESLKIKKDLIEQLTKMKKHPSLDTVCHIESAKYSSEIRYWLLRHLFRNKKYKLIFHKKNIKLEEEGYKKGASKFQCCLVLVAFYFSVTFLLISIFTLFKVKICIMLFLIGLISFFAMLFAWG